jgi:mannonate dehydratase
MKKNRRDFLKKSAAIAALSAAGIDYTCAGGFLGNPRTSSQLSSRWPHKEGPDTPKLILSCSLDADEKAIRRLRQIGVNYVDCSYGNTQGKPWDENRLRAGMIRLKENGLTVINMMCGVGRNTILGREGRDADIERFQECLRVAGACGMPNVEYNWYVARATEGYSRIEARGGSSITGFDYSKIRDLPPNPEVGIHRAEEIWDNITYFLKAVIPVAEKAGVRMALHPNDPVAQISRGSDQIMANLNGWKRLVSIVDSPSNGITFDPGVTQEMGENPVEVCRYFASRDRINHMHYRNVVSIIPYENYLETWIDEGNVDMFAVMAEVIKHGYNRAIWPEHPHFLDYDIECGSARTGVRAGDGGGGYAGDIFNFAFSRAMMMAVMSCS